MKYVAICTALYDYQAQNDEEISFNADNILYILDKEDPDWHKAQLKAPTQLDGGGPIGLIPANYVDKAKPIGTVKAVYDYVSQSAEELSFKEDEVLTLYEKDDPDWFVVEKSNGDIGLAPSNYIQEQQVQVTTPAVSSINTTTPTVNNSNKDEASSWSAHEYNVDKEKMSKSKDNSTPPQPNCEPKWAIALFLFHPEGPEETSLEDNEQVLITDYVTSTEWWTIEHKDGTAGIVPASYVKFQDEYEADLRAEEEEEKKKAAEAAIKEKQRQDMAAREQKRREEYELRDKERQKDLAERNRVREQEDKEKARQLEVERRRKMQEEAKQKEIEAKRQASFAAAAIASLQLGGGSPRRSQIPAPPPPTKPVIDHSSFNQHSSTPVHNDPNKPDPSKVRMWTDRTGAFKVEAQFLSCANGKIRLFKTNGVKIDVPTQKMCVEDLHYIEQETGMKLLEDKSDNIPLGQLSSTKFTWFDYFKRANLPHNACVKYSQSCESSGLGEKDVECLTHHQMKSMGMTERHVQRIQRFIETNHAEPASDDESSRPKIKGKKTVTFGAVSYIEEDDYDYEEDSLQWQIDQDERLARQLQEQEQSNTPITGGLGLHRRGTGRPTPSHSAPKGVNSAVLTPQQFHSEPLKPTPASTLQPQPQQPPLQLSPVAKATNVVPTPSKPAFEDDAWSPRAGASLSVQPANTTTPPAWNHQQVHNRSIPTMNNSIINPSAPPAVSTPPPMPPRQRPTPQLSQQNLVDPQLLAKWGGSPALAAANSRPVPPPPATNNNNFVPPPQLQNQSSMNSLPVQQQPMFYQQQSQLSTGNSSFTSLQHQLPTGNNSFTSLQQQLPTGNSSFTSLSTSNGSFTSLQQQPTGFTPLQQQQVYNSSPSMETTNQQFIGSTASIHTQPLQSVLPPALVPQTQPQMTGSGVGRNWASATPDNPFGGASPSPAPMHNTGGSLQQPQQFNTLSQQNTGYVPQQPYNTIIDSNDKYSVFKTIGTSAPGVFNSNNNNNQQQQRSFYY